MKFGSINPIALSKLDFSLPPDHAANQQLLTNLPLTNEPPSIYIGCAVWTDRSFVGKLYPTNTPAKDYLKLYSQHFNTVELNATFYSIPSIAQVKKWKTSVKTGFKFCPKVPQSISHNSNINEQIRDLDIFLATISQLEEKLGIVFLQLPPDFQPSRMNDLQRLLVQVPQVVPLAVEFRHQAWFNDPVAQEEIFKFLQAHGMAAVISDVAGRRDVLHQRLATNCVFIRFRGYTTYSINYTRLDTWTKQLQHWLDQGLSQVYFMLHETEKAYCLDLAIYLIQSLNQKIGLQLPIPHFIKHQATLF